MKISVIDRRRQDLLRVINRLSLKQVDTALDFLESFDLKDEEWKATVELLKNKLLVRDIMTAKRDVQKHGRGKLMSWRQVRQSHV
jgi:hypothetical protein